MNTLFTQLVGQHRRLVVTLLLAATSVACSGLVVVRYFAVDIVHYVFLLWNLFLAWVPFGAALLAYHMHRCGERGPRLIGVALFWLLFFPNAPYIVSDLVHLQMHGVTPERFIFWYDLVMVSCFSWTGLLLGFVSLYLMQSIVRDRIGGMFSWVFVAITVGLGGFGVYLGRFGRWNSWDLIRRPFDLVADIGDRILHPFDYPQTWGITILFGAMMLLLYVLLYGFVELARNGARARSTEKIITSLDRQLT